MFVFEVFKFKVALSPVTVQLAAGRGRAAIIRLPHQFRLSLSLECAWPFCALWHQKALSDPLPAGSEWAHCHWHHHHHHRQRGERDLLLSVLPVAGIGLLEVKFVVCLRCRRRSMRTRFGQTKGDENCPLPPSSSGREQQCPPFFRGGSELKQVFSLWRGKCY